MAPLCTMSLASLPPFGPNIWSSAFGLYLTIYLDIRSFFEPHDDCEKYRVRIIIHPGETEAQRGTIWEKLNLTHPSAALRFPTCSKTTANQNSTNLSPQLTEMFSGFDARKGKANHEGKESCVGLNLIIWI